MIPVFDLYRQNHKIRNDLEEVINKVLESTEYCDGAFVRDFEKSLREYLEVKYACGVNSGTSSLFLALRALGIKPNDKVIVPANTFIATAWAPAYLNATPVFVDCDFDTANIDVVDLEKKIDENVKCIIGVHLYGNAFDISAVEKISEKYQIPFIEDCAQALGTTYNGKPVGTFGAMGCFSFYPSKNLGAIGEGGAITTSENTYYEKLVQLKNHGSIEKYVHNSIGYNMRMDGIQAAVLTVKMKYFSSWLKRKKEIANRYNTEICNCRVKHIRQTQNCDPTYHLYVLNVDNRNKFINHLSKHQIGYGLHYPICCPYQKAFKYLNYTYGSFPNAEYLSDHIISIPFFPELTDQEIDIIIDAINSYR